MRKEGPQSWTRFPGPPEAGEGRLGPGVWKAFCSLFCFFSCCQQKKTFWEICVPVEYRSQGTVMWKIQDEGFLVTSPYWRMLGMGRPGPQAAFSPISWFVLRGNSARRAPTRETLWREDINQWVHHSLLCRASWHAPEVQSLGTSNCLQHLNCPAMKTALPKCRVCLSLTYHSITHRIALKLSWWQVGKLPQSISTLIIVHWVKNVFFLFLLCILNNMLLQRFQKCVVQAIS